MLSLIRSIEIDNLLEDIKYWIDIYCLENVAIRHAGYNLIYENLFEDAYELAEYCCDKIEEFSKRKKEKEFIITVTNNELSDNVSNIFFNKIIFYITKYDRKTLGKIYYTPLLSDIKDLSKPYSTWNDKENIIENIVIHLSYYNDIDLFGDLLHELKHAYKDYKIRLSGNKGIILSKEKIYKIFNKYNNSHKDDQLTNQDLNLLYNFADHEEADAYISSIIGDLKKQKFKDHKEAFNWLYDNSDKWNMIMHLKKKADNTLRKIKDNEHGQMNEYLAMIIDKNWSKFISKVYSYIDKNNIDFPSKIYETFSHEKIEYFLMKEKRRLKFRYDDTNITNYQ